MALSKTIAKVIAATLFTSFLSLFVILLSVYDLTSYNTLKGISSAQVSEQMKQLQETCKNYPAVEFDVQGEKFSCSRISELDAFATKLFDKNYYKAYNCSILECVKQPAVFFSAFSNNLIWNAILLSITISVISGLVMVLLLDKKIQGLGISIIFVGINAVVLVFARSALPSTNVAAVDSLISSIFNQIAWNFAIILIAGIIVASIGFFLKK